ncbi:MAG: sigma-70 family RNA polymerase sigma factor [Solobacterium sp.]|nr:sigma-70 family RNA polymerase sigma factor [Solobacterium sp.]
MSEQLKQTIQLARSGDEQALAEIIKSYESQLFNLARMYSKTEEDAKDAVQSTFIRLNRGLKTLEDDSKFDSWIKQITVNEAKRIVMSSYNQKNTMFSELDNEEDDLNYDPEDEKIENQPEMAYDKKETSEIVLGILDSLSEDQRIVALMHFYENKTLREIAEELEVPQSTVIGRIQTAKKNIKASVLEMERKDGIKLYNMAPLPFFIYLLHLAQGMPVPASLIRALPDTPVDNLSPNEEPIDKLTPKGKPDTLTPKGGEEGVTENLEPQVNEPEVSTETPEVSEPSIKDEVPDVEPEAPTDVETPQVEEPNETDVPKEVETPQETKPNETDVPKEVPTEVETPKVEQPTETVSKPSTPVQQPQRRFDPKTGKPIGNVPQQNFDPHTGKPIGMNIPTQPVTPVVPIAPVIPVKKAASTLLSTVLKVLLGLAVAVGGTFGGVYIGKLLKEKQDSGELSNVISNITRPSLIAPEVLVVHAEYDVNITDYTLEPNFSNTINPYNVAYLSEDLRNMLAQNYFVVTDGTNYYEFFEVYESNMYGNIPSFITTDSILHTFHLYYAHLQKNVEKTHLSDQLRSMSEKLLEESKNQLNQLSGTKWESAAQRNVDYFAIGAALIGGDSSTLSSNASSELSKIQAAEGISDSPVFTTSDRTYQQDYSQFKPRGYYTESDALKQYFRAMMWYGQMNFSSDDEELSRSALLINKAIQSAAYDEWSNVYLTTSFFAGESDDNGYYEYYPLIQSIYGTDVSIDAIKDDSNFQKYMDNVKQLPRPAINSMVVYEFENRDEVTTGYRVLGQRFTIDGSIMQRLVYRDLPANASSDKRMMPDALDVPAAMGSNRALELLQTHTNVNNWPDYTTNMESVRNEVANLGEETWNASVSSSWLETLRPLLNEDRSQFPKFMQNNAWLDKDLNTFLGNYTELKHDTVLYAKQVMAELGATGPLYEKPDDRGYVEPQPLIYHKLAKLSIETAKALQERNLISSEDYSSMENLSSICAQLATIAEKELRSELPTDEEFEFIRSYGGQLEHLWMSTIDDGKYSTLEHPAALVTDIATDGEKGECLQLAIGKPQEIIVAVYFDDDIRFATGAVYSYYQFTQPISNRLTDEEWQDRVRANEVPNMPVWTSSFYHKYDYYEGAKTPEKLGYYGEVEIRKGGLVTKQSPTMSADDADPAKDMYTYYIYEMVEAEGYTWCRIGKNRWVRVTSNQDVSYWLLK